MNLIQAVTPIPHSRERSESWTPMVRSESDLKSENLARSVFSAVRDSSSSAKKSGGLLGMTRETEFLHRLFKPPFGDSRFPIRYSPFPNVFFLTLPAQFSKMAWS